VSDTGGVSDTVSDLPTLRCALISLAVCALVNPGNFGTIDTVYRLQAARWIRLGEAPAVHIGLIGKDGRRYPWYGIGQSLVLLPFDAISSATVAPALRRMGMDSEKQRQGAEVCTAFLMQFVLTSGVLSLAYRLLLALGFTRFIGKAGSLALLFGTTCLQYVQCAQENLLLLLLALMALVAVRRWLRVGGAVWSMAAGAACGFALLVRLTSTLEAAAIALAALGWSANPKRFLAGFLPGFLPPIALAALIDRCYHWYRFGDWFGTYMSVFARQFRPPDAPASYPFSYPFWKGFLGTLFSLDKSVFLFDPLLLLLLAVAIWRWRQIGRDLRILLLVLTLLFFVYCGFYARWMSFGGDVAWGHRFMTLPVHLLCLLAVPLLMTYGSGMPRAFWAVVIASVVLQAASTAISPQMEYLQKSMGYGAAVIWNRAVNLEQLATGRQEPARIAGIPIEWRTLNYLPFQLRFRFPGLARWAILAWLGVLVCLPWLVWRR
jgi:hypothetical protein